MEQPGITWDGIWNEKRTMLIFLLQNIERPGNICIVPIVLQYLLVKLNFDPIKIKCDSAICLLIYF